MHARHIAILAAFAAPSAGAQGVRIIELKPATASLPEEFTKVTSIRELSDGRVLIGDEKENRVVIADFTTGAVAAVGRKGSGPGEFSQVARIWPLGGDTSLMADGFTRRWLLFERERPILTMVGDAPAIRASAPRPLGVDLTRHIAATLPSMTPGSTRANLLDSMYVVRVELATGRSDTVARVPSEFAGGVQGAPAAPPGAPRSAKPVYHVAVIDRDQITMFADGWIAIAHANPYRIEWCAPQARCTSGPVLLAKNPPLTTRDKQAQLDRAARTRAWPPTQDVSSTTGWPDLAPPFAAVTEFMDGSPMLPAPDGRLLVLRYGTAAAPPNRYDLIDRRGAITGQIVLPPDARIAAFGAKSVYVVETDDDGIQRVRRHPWP